MFDLSGAAAGGRRSWSPGTLGSPRVCGGWDGWFTVIFGKHSGGCGVYLSRDSSRHRLAEGAGSGLGTVWRMSKILTWGTGLALVGALTGSGQLAAVRAAGSWGRSFAVPAAKTALPAAGSWGKAIAVPGLRALNTRGAAEVSSVSCASAGDCAAGGHYQDRHGQQGFVAVERHGRWGTATGVPGLAALNEGGYADASSVSCASAGNCAAGGEYTDADSQDFYGFVAVERNGRWGKAVTVPASEDGYVDSVSCASAGSCLAGGADGAIYTANFNAFFVEERAGHWGHRRSVPGLRTLKHFDSEVSAVACPSAGNCAIGGDLDDSSALFVAGERNGRWSPATAIPGLGALNSGDEAGVNSLSCGSAGNCAAGGYYTDRSRHRQGFVVVERDGVWGTATGVPGLGALNRHGNADVNSVSCGSAGSCAAGGYFRNGDGRYQGFVAVERNGRWGTAIRVPGLAALNRGGDAKVNSVSCASAGNCAAGGYYTDRSRHRQGFVAVERNGRWGTAIGVPGLRALNAGGSAEVGSLSCPSPGHCAAGGSFRGRSGHRQGFVTQPR
jgi:hypothetical protein